MGLLGTAVRKREHDDHMKSTPNEQASKAQQASSNKHKPVLPSSSNAKSKKRAADNSKDTNRVDGAPRVKKAKREAKSQPDTSASKEDVQHGEQGKVEVPKSTLPINNNQPPNTKENTKQKKPSKQESVLDSAAAELAAQFGNQRHSKHGVNEKQTNSTSQLRNNDKTARALPPELAEPSLGSLFKPVAEQRKSLKVVNNAKDQQDVPDSEQQAAPDGLAAKVHKPVPSQPKATSTARKTATANTSKKQQAGTSKAPQAHVPTQQADTATVNHEGDKTMATDTAPVPASQTEQTEARVATTPLQSSPRKRKAPDTAILQTQATPSDATTNNTTKPVTKKRSNTAPAATTSAGRIEGRKPGFPL